MTMQSIRGSFGPTISLAALEILPVGRIRMNRRTGSADGAELWVFFLVLFAALLLRRRRDRISRDNALSTENRTMITTTRMEPILCRRGTDYSLLKIRYSSAQQVQFGFWRDWKGSAGRSTNGDVARWSRL
jgi:MYXO-CTERM domain-containing protein